VGGQRYGDVTRLLTACRTDGERHHVLEIRRKSDGDYRLPGVPWSDIENQGLVFFRCALDVKDHFKSNARAARFRSTSGEVGDPKPLRAKAISYQSVQVLLPPPA
jgi:hypothetical protein